ncbi:MAG: GIY-YIG nuclease family protein [Patescibacteria group bacterium]
MPYFVYILECSDGTLYTGITTDVKRRFKEHQDKKGGGYTSAHGAKRVVYSEKLPSRSAALTREAEIKRLSRKKKLTIVQNFAKKLKKAV